MNKLRFDVEAAKEQLTHVYRDRMAAQGAVTAVQNVDIEDVAFSGLDTGIANLAQLVAQMKTDLGKAQTDGQQWFNEVQPQLTAIPQAAINCATLWNEVMPLIVEELGKSDPNRDELRQLFGALGTSIGRQLAALDPVLQSLQSIHTAAVADAANFSSAHSAFQELEASDAANIAAARATLARLSLLITTLDEQIGVNTINADRDLSLATTAMKYGKKGGNPGEAVGVTIAIVSIISANLDIAALINAVQAKIAAAQKQSEYQLNLTSLSAQLLALESASSALASLVDEIGDMIASLQQTINGWKDDATEIVKIVAALAGTQPLNTIVSLFDLGQAQAQWDTLSVFATRWQSIEVSADAADLLVVDGSLSADFIVAEPATQHANVHAFTGRASC